VRLTTRELSAVLHAITSVTAGDFDGWPENEQAAIESAETKVRALLHARKDYARVEAALAADVDAMLNEGGAR